MAGPAPGVQRKRNGESDIQERSVKMDEAETFVRLCRADDGKDAGADDRTDASDVRLSHPRDFLTGFQHFPNLTAADRYFAVEEL